MINDLITGYDGNTNTIQADAKVDYDHSFEDILSDTYKNVKEKDHIKKLKDGLFYKEGVEVA